MSHAGRADSEMNILTCFGPFSACHDGRPIDLHRRRSDRLLAFLALQPYQRARIDYTLERVWPGGGESSLRKALTETRSALGEGALESQNGQLRLMASISTDLSRFSQEANALTGVERQRALTLYRGPLFEGWDEPEDVWFQHERERWRLVYLELVRQQCQEANSRADFVCAADIAFTATIIHPEFQQAWFDLICAQERLGEGEMARQSAERYLAYQQRMRLTPSPRMEQLMREIRQAGRPRPLSASSSPGPLSLEDRHYVERPADAALRRALFEGQWTILIKGPHQTGKSSLLARGLNRCRQGGQRTIYTDLTPLEEEGLADAGRLCQYLASMLLIELKETRQLQNLWIPGLPPAIMLTELLHDQLLQQGSRRLIWAIDGLDRVFGKPYQDTFFAQLRNWHSQHALHPVPWAQLTLVLVCAREPHLYVQDINQSPFNVGATISTDDLTSEETEKLAETFGLTSSKERAALIDLLGGHPALLNRAFALLAQEPDAIPALLRNPSESTILAGHMHRLRERLSHNLTLVAAMKAIAQGNRCDDYLFWELKSLGLVRGHVFEKPMLRCELYRSLI
jgi:DNA-binding SARP family transcriptional activator